MQFTDKYVEITQKLSQIEAPSYIGINNAPLSSFQMINLSQSALLITIGIVFVKCTGLKIKMYPKTAVDTVLGYERPQNPHKPQPSGFNRKAQKPCNNE